MALDEILLEKDYKNITKIIIRDSIFEFEDNIKLFNKYEEICKKIINKSRSIFNLKKEDIEEDLFEINETVTDKDFTSNFNYEFIEYAGFLKGKITYIKDFGTNTSTIISTNIFLNPIFEDFNYDKDYNEVYTIKSFYTNKEFLKNIKTFYNDIYNIDLINEPRFKKMMKNYSISNFPLQGIEETIISYYEPKKKYKVIKNNNIKINIKKSKTHKLKNKFKIIIDNTKKR